MSTNFFNGVPVVVNNLTQNLQMVSVSNTLTVKQINPNIPANNIIWNFVGDSGAFYTEFPSVMQLPGQSVVVDNIELYPTKNDDWSYGVTTADRLILNNHILGKKMITSPPLLIAADITRNAKITNADGVEMQKMIFGQATAASMAGLECESWDFIDASIFGLITNPFSSSILSYPYYLTNSKPLHRKKRKVVSGQSLVIGFDAIKTGDLNCSSGLNFTGNDSESREIQNSITIPSYIKANSKLILTSEIDDYATVEGWQFGLQFDKNALSYDGYELEEVKEFTSENIFCDSEEGKIRLSYINKSTSENTENGKKKLVKLVFSVKEDISDVANAVKILDEMPIEVLDTDANSTGAKLSIIADVESDNISIFPNPVIDNFQVKFTQKVASNIVTVQIFDANGRLVSTSSRATIKGNNSFDIESANLSKGIYMVKIQTPEKVMTEKFIKL